MVAALLIATAPLAYSQMGTAPPPTMIVATSLGGGVMQADQTGASKMIGSSVYSIQNVDIDTVQDVILDRDGRVASVVVDVGTFLGMAARTLPSG